eukprot:jgi/Orpsp1_1/1190145/evm.model.d7180000076896.1
MEEMNRKNQENISRINNDNINRITESFIEAITKLNTNNSVTNENKNNSENVTSQIINSATPFHIKDFHLTSENFNKWLTPLMHHLISSDLKSYVEDKRNLESMTATEIKLDNKTQSIIEGSLDAEGNESLKGCRTAFEMMKRLKETYYQTGQSFIDNIDNQIKNLRLQNNDYGNYIHKIDDLYNLREIECNKLKKESLDDKHKITQMLTELSKADISPLMLYFCDCENYKEFKDKLLKVYSLTKSVNNLSNINNRNNSLINNVNRIQKGNLYTQQNKNKDNYCCICEDYGHTTKKCFKIKDEYRSNQSNNKPDTGQKKKFTKKKRNNKSKNKSKSRVFGSNNICNKQCCESDEHSINDSDDSDDTSNRSLNLESNKCNLVLYTKITNTINKCKNYKTTTKQTNETQTDDNTFWIIDSGTGINLTCNKNLTDIREVNDRRITYANGSSENIKFMGKYSGKIKDKNFTITDVYYAPNIKNNLISTSHILDSNFDIFMTNDKGTKKLFLIKDNEIIKVIHANDENLFTIYTNDLKSKNKKFNYKYKVHNILVNYIEHDLWHFRLGHFNNPNLDKFVIEHTKDHNKEACITCKLSKLRRNKFEKSLNKSTRLFELVHTDVVGPLTLSYSGYTYYVTFLDDYSRKCWVYPIESKKKVYNIFTQFYTFIKNQYNLNIKTLKSDNGLEYVNSKFNEFISENGINFIHSVPGAHQQNGRAERLNQTLNNCAKSLLNWANLPRKFWDEAIPVAAKLYNLNPHKGNSNLVPDDIFFNKVSDISHLKVFGCKVAFLDNYKKNKLDDNAKQGIFLGYSKDSTGYRILDLNTNSIITAREVYFIENLPGTIHTPFFSNDVIESFFDSTVSPDSINFPIEGETNTNSNNSNISNNNTSNNNDNSDNMQLSIP